MISVDTASVGAFLEERHHDWAATASTFATAELAARPEPADDAAARREARTLLAALGDGGLFAPIGARDLRACCLAREAVAAASPLADAVWALQGLGITPLLLAGTDEQRARWADPALAGKAMGAFAMTETNAGSDVASLTTRAVRDGDDWVLDGAKTLISNAGIADYYVTFASTQPERGSRGITAFLVPADTPGLDFVGAQVMSAAHPLGELRFSSCRVPGSAVIGEQGAGFKLGMATLDQLRPTVGAAACGMARRALDEALAHAVRREQFGKPLADFQIVQDKLGRMAIDLDAARLLVYRAAWVKDVGAERITLEAAMAKAYATEAAQRIIDEGVQILGGRGVLAESVVDRLYRSIRALRIYEGTTEIQHLIVAGRILADARERGRGREDGGGDEGGGPAGGRAGGSGA
jgi:acyl-CoA dehydrogenase